MKKNVAVIGASGAIGNAVSKILLDDESVESVYTFSRSISPNTCLLYTSDAADE